MKINPGGKLSPEQVVGRNAEVARFWQILKRQSLILTGERRLGKSHVMWKMQEEGHGNFLAVYQDLEGVHATTEFVRSIYQAINQHLTRFQKLKSFGIQAWQQVAPKKLKDIDLPDADANWKPLLSGAIADVESVLDDQRLVFMWDEFPLLIDNIAKAEGTDKAIQLLDVLRQLRQTHRAKIRFMFTGSIGLHIVLKSLRMAGHTNAPVNDMHSETLSPLKDVDATFLARQLIETVDPSAENLDGIATEIYAHVGGFPYYIHHVADQLSLVDNPVSTEQVTQIVDDLIFADNDPANLQYYVDRIENYYVVEDADLAFLLLDIVAREESAIGQSELLNRVRHERPEIRDQTVRDVIQLLRQDHYFTLNPGSDESSLDYRWNFIKHWWRKTRV